MKYACIDVGTNSIRLLIADVVGGRLENRQKKLEMARLGKGVNETKMLDPKRMIDSLNAIDQFHREALEAGAEQVFIFATSAVRDAYNGIDFRQMIYNKTGIELSIVSGNAEAEMGFHGVRQTMDSDGNALVIDIGGGSMEVAAGSRDGMKDAFSLNIGAVRLTGACITTDPVAPEEVEALRREIVEHIATIKPLFRPYHYEYAIGIGGTITTFVAMANQMGGPYDGARINEKRATLAQIREINAELIRRSVEERKSMVGLDARRADIILAGGLILEHTMETFGIDWIRASDYDNLEGYLVMQLEL
ncbi:MAG: Ppx/GppA phosphatase family protein [Bacillota bacterium]|nr:Ppx/GppA phosphatase family protein [Bacillota bacterium]